MSTAQPVRQAIEIESSPAKPRIYEPPEKEPPRDLASLFNLRRKPGYYNAEEKAALLRRLNHGPLDELFVDFSRADVHFQLKASGVELAGGHWTWQASVAGQAIKADGPWTEVRWHRKNESDYLEIELPLSDGWRLERQAVLARKDQFLFLADTLIGPNEASAELNHSHTLPLAEQTSFVAATETREAWLDVEGVRRAAVVPPALTEWRVEYCHAELSGDVDRLTLKQSALGRKLFAPLWIDLDPRRMKRPLTWRRLTVAENLAIVPRDVAAAYRIQAGNQQWLIYRSLAPVGNRSVLGHNTFYSFVCSRILPTGDFKAIVEIE